MTGRFLKRAIDILISFTALTALSPLLLLIAVAILLDSGRPVFFRHQRVGRRFRPFFILKFRSMAPQRGPSITVHGDRRITRVGKLLRRAKLDELPQFWNVLRGDMSLVGPRPEVPAYVEMYRPRYQRLLTVRPGITDPASIRFRDEEILLAAAADPLAEYAYRILPAKLDLSESYLDRQSLSLDCRLLWQTLRATVNPRPSV